MDSELEKIEPDSPVKMDILDEDSSSESAAEDVLENGANDKGNSKLIEIKSVRKYY